MDSFDAIRFAREYVKLGPAVQEQLNTLLSEGAEAELNRNAVAAINDFARDVQPFAAEVAEDIIDAVDAWLDAHGFNVGPRFA